MGYEEFVEQGSSKLINEAYARLKPICKPTVRSNGIKEWTVLAGIIAINERKNTMRLVSLGTGVKATPNEELKRSEGKIVHDCHAEILALRGFNTVLLMQVSELTQGKHERVDLVEKAVDGLSFKVPDHWSFALYISKLPCGDSSMDTLEEEDLNSYNIENTDACQYLEQNNHTLLRGRFNYQKKGFVRTKPGRKDSKITLSKSCSDKLSVRQVTSMLNSINWELFDTPIYLKYIIIPNLDEHALVGLERSFKRLCNHPSFNALRFVSGSQTFCDDKITQDQQPSSMSSISLNVHNNGEEFQEAILNGVKNGFYVKSKKPLRKSCESIVSRLSQWQLYNTISSNTEHETYLQFKSTQVERNTLKNEAKLCLSPDGWITTGVDDC